MQKNAHGILPDIERTILMDAPNEKVWKAIATSEDLNKKLGDKNGGYLS